MVDVYKKSTDILKDNSLKEQLLSLGSAAKRERSKATRIRMAGFPQMKYLEELHLRATPAHPPP